MSDTILIGKYLVREYPNDHLALFQYAMGGVRSKAGVIEQILQYVKPVFAPVINNNDIRIAITVFLEDKKARYSRGEIQLKWFYCDGTHISK